MSRFSIISAVSLEDKRLSKTDIYVLALLGTFADKEGWCYPSLRTLGEIGGVSKPAVSKYITRLEGFGYIEKQDQHRQDGSQRSNRYRVLLDYIPPKEARRSIESDPRLTSEVNGGLTSEVNGGLTSEVNPLTPHTNTPFNNKSVCFDRFWSAYPKKLEKKKCAAIWKRRNLDTLGDMIVADVTRRRIDDAQWQDGYIPNPQTYLNGDRWEDQIQTHHETSKAHRNTGVPESRSARASRIFRERHADSEKTVRGDEPELQGTVYGGSGQQGGSGGVGTILDGEYHREES